MTSAEITAERRARALANSIAAIQARARGGPTVDWDPVIARFKQDMAQRYQSEECE